MASLENGDYGDASTCGGSTLGDEEINHAAYDLLLQQITNNWVQREEQFKNCVDRFQAELDTRSSALAERDRAILELTAALEAAKSAAPQQHTAVTTVRSNSAQIDPLGAKECESETSAEHDPSEHNGGLAYLDCSYADCQVVLHEFCAHVLKMSKEDPTGGYDISIIESICDYALSEALELCHLQVCKAAVDTIGCTIFIQVWHDCVVRPLQDVSAVVSTEKDVSLDNLIERLEGLIKGFHDGYREAIEEKQDATHKARLLLFPSFMKLVNTHKVHPTHSSQGRHGHRSFFRRASSVSGRHHGDGSHDRRDSLPSPGICIEPATIVRGEGDSSLDGSDSSTPSVAEPEVEPPARKQVVSPVRESVREGSSASGVSMTLLKIPTNFQASVSSFEDASFSSKDAHIEADRASAAPVAPSMGMFTPRMSVRQNISTQPASSHRNQSSEGNYGDFSSVVGGVDSPAHPTPIRSIRLPTQGNSSPLPTSHELTSINSGEFSSSDSSRRSAVRHQLGVVAIKSLGSSYSTSAPPLSPRSRADIDRRREETFKEMT